MFPGPAQISVACSTERWEHFVRTMGEPVRRVDQSLIIYLFSVNTFTPIERCAIIFVIAQVGKLLIGQKIQKLQNHARCNRSLIGQ